MDNKVKTFVYSVISDDYLMVEEVVEHTDEYLDNLAFEIREERNRLLKESDWTQVLDAPVDRQAWATYRQSLRDLTEQPGFPLEVVFPTKP